MKDVGDRLVNLSDVVEERDTLDAVTRAVVEACCIGKDQGIGGDTPDVSPC